jgi:hypothetical protein
MRAFARHSTLAICLLAAAIAAGCRRQNNEQPPVATPSVTFNHPRAPLGSPLEVTYKFQVAPDATFAQDYRVMVHFLDGDEELMWTDDHQPPVPTSQWKPGQVVEYSRTVFIPLYPYLGEASVQIGLYSTRDQSRLALSGPDSGQRAYKVATLQLLPHSENVFLMYKDGWHPGEVAPDNAAVEWQWTKKAATIAFRNPKKDSTFYLHADNPGSAFTEPQTVQLRVNGQVVDTVTVAPKQEFIRKTPLSAAQLGTGEMVELMLEVDKTFVPALLPNSSSPDRRELGVRILHAFIEPVQ